MSRHFTSKALLAAALLALCATLIALPQAAEVALRQIIFATEQAAQQAHAELSAGASFEALAAERSRDATAQRGGYLGRMRLSDLRPEVRKALESIQPGKVSNPVQVGDTYVLFQIVPEAESRWIDFDEAGAKALADGRNTEAIAYFEKALAHSETTALGDSRLARSLDSLATAYRLVNRAAEAEKLYRRALALLENLKAGELQIARVADNLGITLVRQGRLTEAQPLYERARSIREKRLGPDHPEVAATLHNIAELSARLGRFVDAAKLYEQAQAVLEQKLGPRHPASVAGAQNLQAFQRSLIPELLERFSTAAGLAEFRDDEFTRIISEIRELLPLAPLSEQSYVQMKDILMEAGLKDETEEVLRAGLKKFPGSRLLRIYFADFLAGTGRTQIALNVLEEASQLPRPEAVDAVNERQQQSVIRQRIGDLQSALGNFDGAVEAYRRSLELDPAAPAGRIKLGKAFFSSNRLAEAVAELEQAIIETPNDNEAHLSLSEVHVASGRWEQAAASAERAVQLGARDPRALYLLGTALVRMGRRDQGRQRLQEFARVEADFQNASEQSRNIDAIHVKAIETLRQGNGAVAIQQLTEGIARYPDDSRLRMTLATIQSRLGQHQMAIDTLQAMIERGIGRRFLIHKNLASAYQNLGNTEASARHRKVYLETRETELVVR